MNTSPVLTQIHLFRSISCSSETKIPIYSPIRAGFPSPAGDFITHSIDLNKTLIKHPSSTFFARVEGHSMKNIGIDHQDLLIIDRSLTFTDNAIVVCYLDGEFTVKRLKLGVNEHYLISENEDFAPIIVTKDNHLIVWGLVTNVIKFFTKCSL